jgi:hypothetical protein
VNEVASLFQSVLAAALVVVAPVVLVTWLGGPGRGWGLADLLRFQSETPWPRGVQEEEPIRWNVELLGRSAYATGLRQSVPDHPGVPLTAPIRRCSS